MARMLLSVKPIFVESIISGQKLYEYRKFRCKKDVKKIIIYATSPRKQVVGEADIEEILEGTPNDIWKKTKDNSGITRDFFCEYYKNKKKRLLTN